MSHGHMREPPPSHPITCAPGMANKPVRCGDFPVSTILSYLSFDQHPHTRLSSSPRARAHTRTYLHGRATKRVCPVAREVALRKAPHVLLHGPLVVANVGRPKRSDDSDRHGRRQAGRPGGHVRGGGDGVCVEGGRGAVGDGRSDGRGAVEGPARVHGGVFRPRWTVD